MSDSHLLQAGDARASISPLGAECRHWQIGARQMLWPGDAHLWPAIAPVLFPTCGWSREGRIRLGEMAYPMPVHGFAAGSIFSATRISESEMCFLLEAHEATRAHYPFNFALRLTYQLAPFALSVTFEIENRDSGPLPYAVGLHPGFAINWGLGRHRFLFGADERAQVPIIAAGGLFSRQYRPVPLMGQSLDLSPSLFGQEALCFLNTRARSFALEGPEGRLQIEAPDFPHLVLWNRLGGPFLAIESWTGTGDPEGFEGSLFERPSMIHLEPGDRRMHHVRYSWEPLGSARHSP